MGRLQCQTLQHLLVRASCRHEVRTCLAPGEPGCRLLLSHALREGHSSIARLSSGLLSSSTMPSAHRFTRLVWYACDGPLVNVPLSEASRHSVTAKIDFLVRPIIAYSPPTDYRTRGLFLLFSILFLVPVMHARHTLEVHRRKPHHPQPTNV
jgi:hypothetical protein